MTDLRPRSWARLLLGYGLAIATLAFTARSLNSGLSQVNAAPMALEPVALIACALLMACHTLLNREGFVALCEALDSGLPPATIRRIWGRSLLAKYVPGGIWQLVGRGLQMRQLGSLHNSAVYSGILEQALSMLLCLTIAVSAHLLLSRYHALGIATILLPFLTVWLVARLTAWVKQPAALQRAAILYAAAMPFYLAAYACVVWQFPLLELCAYLFTGTVAGMLAFLVPGGLGVRESVISLLAANTHISLLTAMMVVRLITIGIEVLITVAGLAARRKP